MRLNQITVPAGDIEASTAFYKRLGFKQIVAAPHYARFEAPEGDATFSIATDHGAAGGTVVYLECDDLDATVQQQIRNVVGRFPPARLKTAPAVRRR